MTNKITDLYWKECYTSIRKWYNNPILIIDDSSNRAFLNENIHVTNCTVIYDHEYKGGAELLPYYYFYKLKPFDTAVILHDSVFIQSKIDFELDDDKQIRFLWSFPHHYDDEIFHLIHDLFKELPCSDELVSLYYRKSNWIGCFGVMSIIRWPLLETLEQRHHLFTRLLPTIKCRANRHALERVFALLVYLNTSPQDTVFGDISSYIRWGITFTEYLQNQFPSHPIVKVWTAR